MPATRSCVTVSDTGAGSSKSGRNELSLDAGPSPATGGTSPCQITKEKGMADKLKHLRVAIIATEGFEGAELKEPRRALDAEGADTKVLSPTTGEIKAWEHDRWGDSLRVDQSLAQANPDEFDALLLPGGVINADKIRTEQKAIEFVRRFAQSGKPMAVICHAPWLLIEPDIVRGRTVASLRALETDL